MTEKIKVAFQGEKGAYSHLACLEIFPNIEKNFLTRTGRKMTAVEKTAMESKFFKDLDDLIRVESTDKSKVRILKSSALRHKGSLLKRRRALVAKANPRHIEKLRDQLKVLNAKTKTMGTYNSFRKSELVRIL